ncbi:MAG TPA: hypothetical protein VHV74_27430 [Pseudonocardiaceae bacterium]|nr:hypothetical protein [Pseudonocardiaceae bacterium]
MRATVSGRPDEPRAVGRLTLNEESLRLPDDPGQRLICLGATPASESANRLRLLS